MNLNDFVDLTQSLTGTKPDVAPQSNHSEQVQVGLEFAKRQAEKPAVEAAKIPQMVAYPVPS